MGQLVSHVPKPTAEQRTEMLELLGALAAQEGDVGPGMTEEQLAYLYSDAYVPPNMDKEAIILTAIVLFFLVGSIGLRFFSRYKYGAQNGPLLDDWVVLGATIACITYAIVNLYGYLYAGFGRFTYDLDVEHFNRCLKLFIVNFTTFAVANTAVKVSILILYRRIFDSMQTVMRRVVYALIILNLIFLPISIGVQIAICKPFEAFWHLEWRLRPDVKCTTGAAGSYAVGIIRTIMDVVIFVLPLKHIWSIKNFSIRKKLMITGVFTLGLVACMASILKLAFYGEFLHGDLLRGAWKIVVVEAIEYTSAIVAACVPALLPMLKTVYKNAGTTIRQITSGGKSQIQTTVTHVGPGGHHTESIKMKGIKVSHAVSQTVELHNQDDDAALIIQMPDDNDDKDSKVSYSRSQSSV